MRKNKKASKRPVARELSAADAEKLLIKIGKALKDRRKGRTTVESFAYEINASRSQINRYEAGGDMLLSTFLKILHGLDIDAVEFFKGIK